MHQENESRFSSEPIGAASQPFVLPGLGGSLAKPQILALPHVRVDQMKDSLAKFNVGAPPAQTSKRLGVEGHMAAPAASVIFWELVADHLSQSLFFLG
jgi:hypothetical protein